MLDVDPSASRTRQARARLAADLTAAAGVNLLGPLREEDFRLAPPRVFAVEDFHEDNPSPGGIQR